MGSPNLPISTEFEFKYYLYDELKEFLNSLVSSYPNLIRIEEIGQTYEGRAILCAKITNFDKEDKEKPAYYVEGNIHAGEITGSTVSLYIISYLCSHYEKYEEIKSLLDKFVFYVVPRISIDGAERYMTTPYSLRSSTRYWPYPEKLPGFHSEDLNGDGDILMMRMQDPLGDWKVSDLDPRIMNKRGMDEYENGPYYRLFPEGNLHDWQEGEPIMVTRPPEGLDLNRNNPSGPWSQEHIQQGAGPFPLSEPETRAIADFFRDHLNICGVQSFHTFSGVILRPFSYFDDKAMETHDLEVYKKLGDIGENLTGYPCININKDFKYDRKKELFGGFLDWIFEHKGIFSFSTELWDMIKEAGIEDRDYIKFLMFDRTDEEELKLLKWSDKILDGKGFANWEEFDHPQLGKVEIGGWRFKYTWQNPPIDKGYLEDICHNNALFAFAHARVNPRVSFDSHSVEKIEANGKDHWKISLSIVNEGFLPTYVSDQANQRRFIKENELKIECENCELVAPSKKTVKFNHLQGRSNKLHKNMFFGFSPEDQKWVYDFVVKGDEGSKVHLTSISERGGTSRISINLEQLTFT